MSQNTKQKTLLKLPKRIVTRRDIIETIREVEALRENIIARSIEGSTVAALKPTERLRVFVEENEGLELNESGIDAIISELRYLVDHAPVLRFVFAGEPESDFMQELIEWVRGKLDQSAIILYSVQPQIAGGFLLTTDRQRYDHSWRTILHNSPLALGEKLRAGSTKVTA
ncbi:TPA: hypothetical protein EYO12_02615 [Candidatus Saccharibacteria bacterium]|nr:hypothetical protein [Candidatus Saccharibacteria bacterium]HIO88068.1 hypothetical protein [Candidatus Saccharibacteria bacterium]